MPRARIAWRDVWIGAAVTAFLFEIGKLLIGLYLGKTSVASGFGAAGSLLVLLVGVYFAAQIFLLGAEFTWAYAHERGSKANNPGSGWCQLCRVFRTERRRQSAAKYPRPISRLDRRTV